MQCIIDIHQNIERRRNRGILDYLQRKSRHTGQPIACSEEDFSFMPCKNFKVGNTKLVRFAIDKCSNVWYNSIIRMRKQKTQQTQAKTDKET